MTFPSLIIQTSCPGNKAETPQSVNIISVLVKVIVIFERNRSSLVMKRRVMRVRLCVMHWFLISSLLGDLLKPFIFIHVDNSHTTHFQTVF